MMIEYVGLAEKVRGGYTVFFPDFPGFGSEGKTLAAARKNAHEGLLSHIELMIESQEAIPEATSLDEVMKSKDAKDCIPLCTSIIVPSQKSQRINITMNLALIDAIDTVARAQRKTRSAFLAEAAQHLLAYA